MFMFHMYSIGGDLYQFEWDSSEVPSLNVDYYIDIKVVDNYMTHNEGIYNNIGIFKIK